MGRNTPLKEINAIDSQQLAQNVAVKQSTKYLDDPDLRFKQNLRMGKGYFNGTNKI